MMPQSRKRAACLLLSGVVGVTCPASPVRVTSEHGHTGGKWRGCGARGGGRPATVPLQRTTEADEAARKAEKAQAEDKKKAGRKTPEK